MWVYVCMCAIHVTIPPKVQMFHADGTFLEAVQGVVAPWPAPGRFVELSAPAVSAAPEVKAQSRALPTEGLLVGVPSMSAVGRHLLQRACSVSHGKGDGMEVHLDRTAVVDGRLSDGQWKVSWKRGQRSTLYVIR